MHSRFIKGFLMFVLYGLVGLIGVYIGIGYIKSQIEATEQKEDKISLIAVVDLDEGVTNGETIRYYAAELMTFPNENFKLASLEEARNGVLNGTFGAYIIIPASFSKSVESLNFTPVKSIVEYSVNPNLADEVRIVVESDISLFWRNISERVSYMYVTSIMTEFHDVQDDSEVILENDIADMNNIEAINAEELAQTVEFSEMEVVESELEYIDLSDEIESNTGYVQGIIDIYTEAQTAGEEQLTGLSTGLENIQNSKEELDEEVLNLNFIEDDEGNLVIQEEIDSLDEELLLTQESRQNCKDDIKWLVKTSLYNQEGRHQSYINDELTALKQAEQERFNLWYAELQQIVGNDGISWPDGFECMADISVDLSQNRVRETQNPEETTPDINDPTLTDEEKRNIEINTFAMEQELSEKIESIIFVSDDVVRIIKEEIETKVITILTDGCNSFGEKITTVNSSITDYLTVLSEYTPLDNLDQEGLTENLQGLNENIAGMQTEINENTTEEMEYVAEVYTTASENVELLRNDIITANNETINNVNSAVAELKTNREEMNKYNEEILSSFSSKLPYSRLGDLENQQVNSYVVSPLTFEEIVIEKSVNQKIEDHFEMILIIMITTLGFCTIVTALFYIYQFSQVKRKKLK